MIKVWPKYCCTSVDLHPSGPLTTLFCHFNIFKVPGMVIHHHHRTDTLLVVPRQVVIHLRPIPQEAQLVRDPVGHHNTQVTRVDHRHKGVRHHHPRRQLQMICTVGLLGHSNLQGMVPARLIQEVLVVLQQLLLDLQIPLNLMVDNRHIRINIRYVFRVEICLFSHLFLSSFGFLLIFWVLCFNLVHILTECKLRIIVVSF